MSSTLLDWFTHSWSVWAKYNSPYTTKAPRPVRKKSNVPNPKSTYVGLTVWSLYCVRRSKTVYCFSNHIVIRRKRYCVGWFSYWKKMKWISYDAHHDFPGSVVDAQYAEVRCYPKKRCLCFDFRFKKISIKQVIFVNEQKNDWNKKKSFLGLKIWV